MKLFPAMACAAALALTATASSAAVICNDEGDCWRVKEHRDYDPGLKLRVYDDNWKWKDGEKYRWREPGAGHGYYAAASGSASIKIWAAPLKGGVAFCAARR